jgi:hypothetical protein
MDLGMAYFYLKIWKMAMDCFITVGDANPECYYYMANMFMVGGNGVEQDMLRGRWCLKRASDFRIQKAMVCYASYCMSGFCGIQRNLEEARMLLELSLPESSDGTAEFYLGMLLESTDLIRAIELLKKSAEHDHVHLKNARGRLDRILLVA